MLEGLVQHDHPLTLQHILQRMRRMYGESEVVTLTDDGTTRASYAEICERIDRLCNGLRSLGVGEGDRVATFAWNSQRHLEAYMGVPCMGAVLHTVNIRLSAADITYIVNHAGDKVLIVDASCWPTLEPIRKQLKTVEHVIVDASLVVEASTHTRSDVGWDGLLAPSEAVVLAIDHLTP